MSDQHAQTLEQMAVRERSQAHVERSADDSAAGGSNARPYEMRADALEAGARALRQGTIPHKVWVAFDGQNQLVGVFNTKEAADLNSNYVAECVVWGAEAQAVLAQASDPV